MNRFFLLGKKVLNSYSIRIETVKNCHKLKFTLTVC